MTNIRFELPEINTWRLFNKAVSQRQIVDMVEAWEAHGYRFGCVCIDDGWTVDGKLGDWEPNPQRFPDLLALEGDAADIRCTAWEKDGVVKRLVMNVGTEAYTAKFAGKAMSLQPGEVAMV